MELSTATVYSLDLLSLVIRDAPQPPPTATPSISSQYSRLEALFDFDIYMYCWDAVDAICIHNDVLTHF